MKTIKYTPKKSDDGEAAYAGHVEIQVLSYPERMAALKSVNVVVQDGKVELKIDPLDASVKVYELVMKQTLSVDLLHRPTGERVVSIEELGYSADGSQLISEIGNMLLGGLRLGELSSPR